MKARSGAALLYLLIGLVVLAVPASAQQYVLQPGSTITVDGKSNKSDFTVVASDVEGTMTMDPAAPAVSAVDLTIASDKIKSDRSTIMDRLMRDALKVSEHPTITFELIEATPTGSSGLTFDTRGNLTLAGVTREVSMQVSGTQEGDAIRFTGSTPIKMSDYDIQPPVAMFGALRTADDVTVSFDVVFKPGS